MVRIDRDHYSYSQINQFLRICPMQFAFQRIHKIESAFVTETLPFGSAIHRTAEHLWAKRMDGKDATADELAELFAEVWSRQVKATTNLKFVKADYDTLCQLGQGMMRHYRENFGDDIEVEGFNVPFLVPLIDRHGETLEKPIVGEIDLLIRQGGRLIAVDLKTAAQRYSSSKVNTDLQPTVYLYALRMLGYDALFRWDVLLKTKKPAFELYVTDRTDEDIYRLVDLVKIMESMIEAGHILPNEGSHFCPGCGYRDKCRTCHEVANPADRQPQLAAV